MKKYFSKEKEYSFAKNTFFNLLKCFFFMFISVMTMSVASNDKVRADLNHCMLDSGGTHFFYVNDDGKCINTQYNSYVLSLVPQGDVNGTIQSLAHYSGNTSNLSHPISTAAEYGGETNQTYMFSYANLNSILYFYETDHCTHAKDVWVYRFNFSGTYLSMKQLADDGDTFTLSKAGIYVVEFFGTSNCTIFNQNSADREHYSSVTFIIYCVDTSYEPNLEIDWGFTGNEGYYNTTSVTMKVKVTSQIPLSDYEFAWYYGTCASASDTSSSCTRNHNNHYNNDKDVWQDWSLNPEEVVYTTNITDSITLPSTTKYVKLVFGVGNHVIEKSHRVWSFDTTVPNVSGFSISDNYTVGRDSNKYVVGDTIGLTVKYYEANYLNYNIYVDGGNYTSNCSITSGTMTSSTSTLTVKFNCNISSLTVNFDDSYAIAIQINDLAGNYSTKSLLFYKIDDSRDLEFDTFYVKSKGAKANNYISPTASEGDIYVYYVVSSHVKSYFDRTTAFANIELGSNGQDDNLISGTGCLKASGGLYSFDDACSATIYDRWVSGHTNEGYDTVYFTVSNIYGRSTTVTQQVYYDPYDPLTPTYTNSSGGSQTSSNVTITVSGSDDRESGLWGYEWSTSGSTWYSNWTSKSGTTSATMTWTTNTWFETLYLRACDYAGNCTQASTTTAVLILKGGPELSVSIYPSMLDTYVTQVGSGRNTMYVYDYGRPSSTHIALTISDNTGIQYNGVYDAIYVAMPVYYYEKDLGLVGTNNYNFNNLSWYCGNGIVVCSNFEGGGTQTYAYLDVYNIRPEADSTTYNQYGYSDWYVFVPPSFYNDFGYGLECPTCVNTFSSETTNSSTARALLFRVFDRTMAEVIAQYTTISIETIHDVFEPNYTSGQMLDVTTDAKFYFHINESILITLSSPYQLEGIPNYLTVHYGTSATSFSSTVRASRHSVSSDGTKAYYIMAIPNAMAGSTARLWYLAINSTQIPESNGVFAPMDMNGTVPTSTGYRVFKCVNIPSSASVNRLRLGSISNGSVVGSGTDTIYYSRPSASFAMYLESSFAASSTVYGLMKYYEADLLRYCWVSETDYNAGIGCDSVGYTTAGSSAVTYAPSNPYGGQIAGSVTVPSTAGEYVLLVYGNMPDIRGGGIVNSTNINGITGVNYDYSDRAFRFRVYNGSPTIKLDSITGGGTLSGTGMDSLTKVYTRYPTSEEELGTYTATVVLSDTYGFSGSNTYTYYWSTGAARNDGDAYTPAEVVVDGSTVYLTINIPVMSADATRYLTFMAYSATGSPRNYVNNSFGAYGSAYVWWCFYFDNTAPIMTINSTSGTTVLNSFIDYDEEGNEFTQYVLVNNSGIYVDIHDTVGIAYPGSSPRYSVVDYNGSYLIQAYIISASTQNNRTLTFTTSAIRTYETTTVYATFYLHDTWKDMAGNLLSPTGGTINTESNQRPEYKIVIDQLAPEINVSATTEGMKSGTTYYAYSGDTLTIDITDDIAIWGISDDGSVKTDWAYCWASSNTINSCGSSTQYTVLRDDNNRVILDRLTTTVTVPGTSTSAHTYYYLFVFLVNDYANNVATAIDSSGTASPYAYYYFFVENGKPTGSITSIVGNDNAESGYTNTTQLTVTLSIQEGYGLRRTELYYQGEDGTDWILVAHDDTVRNGGSNTVTLTFNLEAMLGYAVNDGTLKFGAHAYDMAGNNQVIDKDAEIILDRVAPDLCLNVTEGGTGSTVDIGSIGTNKFYFIFNDDNGVNNSYYQNVYIYYYIASENSNFKLNDYYNSDIDEFNKGVNLGSLLANYPLQIYDISSNIILYAATHILNNVYDYAGNELLVDTNDTTYGKVLSYTFRKWIITNTENINYDKDGVVPVDSILSEMGEEIISGKETTNRYQINYNNEELKNYLIVELNQYTANVTTLSTILDDLNAVIGSYNILNMNTFTIDGASSVYKDTILLQLMDDDNNTTHVQTLSLILINNSPKLKDTSNSGSKVEVEYGSEVSNVGMSFVGEKEGEVKVETLITLNGVKVKEIDTKVAGVYSITQVARDSKGRSARVVKEVIVKENEEVETKIKEEAEIVELVEVVAPVTSVNVSESVNEVATREVVETSQVTMRVERKVKVRGYSKKKEVRKTKKEKFSFKLFSKYFFKIYDG